MSKRVWTDADLKEIHAWRVDGQAWSWIAQALTHERGGGLAQVDHENVRKRYNKALKTGLLDAVLSGNETETMVTDGVEWTHELGGDPRVTITGRGKIKTIPQLIEAAEIDLDKWFIPRAKARTWNMGAKDAEGNIQVEQMFSVWADLQAIPGVGDFSLAAADIIEDMHKHAPAYRDPPWVGTNEAREYMGEINILDHHIGMLSWHEETGADWDSDIAVRVHANAIGDLLGLLSRFELAEFLLPLGHDFMHSDTTIGGAGGATTKGTPLDVDTRWPKMFRAATQCAVAGIDRLREVAPVKVEIVPGNHDADRGFMLGEVLSAWYRHDDAVVITNKPKPRKYIQHGKVMLLLAHGHNEKPAAYPLLMPAEEPHMWADTTHREVHIGHTHALKESVNEYNGVRVRVGPSLTPPDAWHAGKGFINHVRAAEAFLWHPTDCFVGMFSVGART